MGRWVYFSKVSTHQSSTLPSVLLPTYKIIFWLVRAAGRQHQIWWRDITTCCFELQLFTRRFRSETLSQKNPHQTFIAPGKTNCKLGFFSLVLSFDRIVIVSNKQNLYKRFGTLYFLHLLMGVPGEKCQNRSPVVLFWCHIQSLSSCPPRPRCPCPGPRARGCPAARSPAPSLRSWRHAAAAAHLRSAAGEGKY